jgi:hypothetical protein
MRTAVVALGAGTGEVWLCWGEPKTPPADLEPTASDRFVPRGVIVSNFREGQTAPFVPRKGQSWVS